MDTTVFPSIENPAVEIQESFDEKDINLRPILTDQNQMLDILPRLLLVATRNIKEGDELFYEKGKNYYVNLGTFQELSAKEQTECKAYYGIKVADMIPSVKTWKQVLSNGSRNELMHQFVAAEKEEKKVTGMLNKKTK